MLVMSLMALVAFMGLVACGSGDDAVASTVPTSASPGSVLPSPDNETGTNASSPPTPSTEVERGPLGNGEAVTIAFAGDSSFQGLAAGIVGNPTGLLAAIAPVLSDADLTMVNLEAALGSGGTPEPKAFTFQTPAETIDALAAAGVDVVTMANNHGMDFGEAGLESSLRIRAGSPMPILGIGRDSYDALEPFITEIRGQRVAFLAANDVFDSSLQARWTATPERPGLASAKGIHQERLLDAVSDARENADTVVVYLHYGRETETCPNQRQVELARSLFDAGADIVVGSHAHRLQGVGFAGDRFVAYGLGNFIFRPGSSAGRETGVLVVTVTGSRVDSFEWRPAVINDGLPVPLTGQHAAAEMDKMDRLRACAGLSSTRPDPGVDSTPSLRR